MLKVDIHWSTADHCGGILYGPYTRKRAFEIQAQMAGEGPCDRQDVFLVAWVGERPYRLLRFKCKGLVAGNAGMLESESK